MKNKKFASFLLRIGLAVAFLYAAIASFLEPSSWIGYFPLFLRELIPPGLLLIGFSVFELGLALWLLSNFKPRNAALLASFALLAILVTNITLLDVIFRDVALLFSAFALVVLESES